MLSINDTLPKSCIKRTKKYLPRELRWGSGPNRTLPRPTSNFSLAMPARRVTSTVRHRRMASRFHPPYIVKAEQWRSLLRRACFWYNPPHSPRNYRNGQTPIPSYSTFPPGLLSPDVTSICCTSGSFALSLSLSPYLSLPLSLSLTLNNLFHEFRWVGGDSARTMSP